MIKHTIMSLGLFFFVSSIMGGDFAVPVSETKKQIHHAEIFRNVFSYASYQFANMT